MSRRKHRNKSIGTRDGIPANIDPNISRTCSKTNTRNEQFFAWPNSRPAQLALWGGLFAVVGTVVVWAHRPALSAQAIFIDDTQYLTENYVIQNPSWTSAKRFLTEVLAPSTVEGYYQPLAMISLMLDVALGGRPGNLEPFHRTSLTLHVINTLLIVVLLYQLFGNPWVAAMIGLLFGIHPMTVEPIPWIGERKTLLAAFFSLLALIAYVRFAGIRGQGLGASKLITRHSALNTCYFVCIGCYTLALLSKPTSTPLPVCMLLLDYWPLKRLSLRTIVEKAPIFFIGIISAIITILSQHGAGGVYNPGQQSLLHPLLILCHNIVFYPLKIVCPTSLSPYYSFPEPMAVSHPLVLAGVIGTCILIPILVISLRWTRALLTGWLFFFVAIFPTLGVIGFTIVIASDKYAYLPSIGILIMLACLLNRLWSSGMNIPFQARTIRQMILCAIVLVVAASETLATRRYLAVWQDSETLYSHALNLAPRAEVLHNNLGLVLAKKARTNEAINHYQLALQLKPDYVEAHVNLGVALAAQGKPDEAIVQYRRALQLKPDNVAALVNLGPLLAAQGKIDEVITHCRRAIELNPNSVAAHVNLGIALLQRKETDEAITHFRRALQLKPDSVETYLNLGLALASQGKAEEAMVDFRQALQLNPKDVKAHYHLGDLLQKQGLRDEAIAEFQEVLRIDPRHERAQRQLRAIESRPTE